MKIELTRDSAETMSELFAAVAQLYRFSADSVYLSPAPLYHAAPLRFNLLTLFLGGTSVIMRRFDPVAALEAIETYRCTHSQRVPTMFIRMLKLTEAERSKHDVSGMQVAIHAAALCPKSIDFIEALPRLATGKLYKRLLKDQYWGSDANSP